MATADWQELVKQWERKQWREEARFARLMHLVAKAAGGDAELDDFLPPHPDTPPKPDRGQHGLAAYLKGYVRSNQTDGNGGTPRQDGEASA